MKEYYDTRAPEYDEWYRGEGAFARRERPGWDDAVAGLAAALERMRPARTLDVACGTAFLTRHLPGEITGLDQSERMIAIARHRVPHATFLTGDALALPFADGAFERLFTGHFYGHLETGARERFLREAARVAGDLVVVDSAVRPDHGAAEWQERVLNDGSRFEVFKRYFVAEDLAHELGGGKVVFDSPWFVGVAVPAQAAAAPSPSGSR